VRPETGFFMAGMLRLATRGFKIKVMSDE